MKTDYWQEKERKKLYRLLGSLPPRRRKITATLVEKTQFCGYHLEKLVLHLNDQEPVPAYFARPLNVSGKIPGILYNHAHGGDYQLGKDELIYGRKGLQTPAYGKVLTDSGYAILCIDCWCFGERRGRSESEVFKEMLWKGKVLWGMMVYDSLRAIDYLVSRPEVDGKRLATMGMSMGSTMAWWVAALDTRIKVCVDLCCLTDYQSLIQARGLDGHGIYYYVPSLLKHFTTARINALIAPRYHLSLAGDYDFLTPTAGLEKIDAELKKIYAGLGASFAWQLQRYPVGHLETAQMRQEVMKFLHRYL